MLTFGATARTASLCHAHDDNVTERGDLRGLKGADADETGAHGAAGGAALQPAAALQAAEDSAGALGVCGGGGLGAGEAASCGIWRRRAFGVRGASSNLRSSFVDRYRHVVGSKDYCMLVVTLSSYMSF